MGSDGLAPKYHLDFQYNHASEGGVNSRRFVGDEEALDLAIGRSQNDFSEIGQ
jgi:hypothetical protein